MSTDTPLEDLPAEKLNEVFAVECLGYLPHKVWFNPPNTALYLSSSDLTFCTDANAVMPYLEKWDSDMKFNRWDDFGGPNYWECSIPGTKHSAQAPTFARAAVLALIKAKRASIK